MTLPSRRELPSSRMLGCLTGSKLRCLNPAYGKGDRITSLSDRPCSLVERSPLL
ncbi:MAG: hypothetical protein HC936_02645 [Leptolyngbyaceae cyanobacterium SU_3_3]|nr:hypothetical protein [Leptolyngbyaceae cyanobacterium SU_3_3]